MKGRKMVVFLEEKTLVILCFLLQYKDSREKSQEDGERKTVAVHAVDRITWPTYHKDYSI